MLQIVSFLLQVYMKLYYFCTMSHYWLNVY